MTSRLYDDDDGQLEFDNEIINRKLVDKSKLLQIIIDKSSDDDEEGQDSPFFIGSQQREMDEQIPNDRFYFVYAIILIHGIGVLMPWNMFITATGYFVEYKLGGHTSKYGKDFLSYLGICSQLPNLLFSLINTFWQTKGSLSRRIVISLLVVALICVVTMVLAVIDSSQWINAFFLGTMASVVVLNAANGVYQNTIYGLTADFPSHLTNAIIIGNNLCGLFVSLANLGSLLVTPSLRLGAIYYFGSSLIVILLCFASYFALPFSNYYRYYHEKGEASRRLQAAEMTAKRSNSPSKRADHLIVRFRRKFSSFVVVFRLAWMHFWNVFFVMFVSLTIFPAMMADIKPVDKNFLISYEYFTPITTFLLFNAFSFFGSILAHFFQKPGPSHLWLPILLRGLMIPFFMFCNYKEQFRSWPVYIDNDLAYIGMAILMSVTNGYFTSLCMMYVPRVVEPSKSRTAGMMAAFFLIFGIFCGLSFTFEVVFVNEHLGPNTPNIVL